MSSIQKMFNQAVSLHQRGQFEQAEVLYKNILKIQNKNFDALHMLGVIAMQMGRLNEAVALIRQAISINPNLESAHSNIGYAYGFLKRHDEALESYDRALKLKPGYAEAHNNRGNTLLELKRYEEALASYDRALALKPDHANAHNNRGTVLGELNRHEEALESFGRTLMLKPDHVDAHNSRGNSLYKLGRHEEALASYRSALALKPDNADARYNTGNVMRELNRHEEALASYYSALALKPDYVEAYNNCGNVLFDLNRLDEAVTCYNRALAIKPDYAEAYHNRAKLLQELNRNDDAIANCEQALALKPDYADAHLNESFCRLRLGDLAVGWEKYEWRWETESLAALKRSFPQPLWIGDEPLAGKTILLHAEQGFGDTIQFIRYAGMVASHGATVLLEVQPALKTLLASVPGVTQIFAKGDALPVFDYHCPLLSLPLACKTRLHNIPAQNSYLYSDPDRVDKWRDRLGHRTLPRIGLAWSGNATHKNDRNRSIPLSELTSLLSIQAQFFSLQKDVRVDDLSVLEAHPAIRPLGDEFGDFVDTAAAISLMDIVITVDTSIAHLAGALGKQVWILLPFSPDWRWLLDRTDSPWYPTARLFRQTVRGDWASVIESVQVALLELAHESVNSSNG